MLFLEDALQKFESLDPEVVFIVNSDRFTRKIGELSQKFGVDLNAAVLYCVVGDLRPEEVADYLSQENDIAEGKAKLIADDLDKQVLKPMESRLLFLNSDPDKDGMNDAQEKDILRQMFRENLLPELQEQFLIKNAVNMRIFDLLEKDSNFKRELERLLYENNEAVTKNNIMADKKSASPSIANWLKDFIAKNGTSDFNSVVLSNYLTNSENTRNLSQEERTQLFSLFNLYRNLKFFPDTVDGKPMEEWRIIPFDAAEAKEFIERDNKKFQAAENAAGGGAREEVAGQTIEQKLSQFDWSKIVGIERRALLEELGVGLKDFVKWTGEKK